MAIIECKYKMSSESIPLVLGCAAKACIDEQADAIARAFEEIVVTISVDDDWGFCQILAVNGKEVSDV